MRPTVYVVQENNRVDYSDAERFGELVFITKDEYRPLQNSLVNNQIRADIANAMSRIKSGDFLILTGNPAMIGFAFHHACKNLNPQDVNVLQWDKMTGTYKPFAIPTIEE